MLKLDLITFKTLRKAKKMMFTSESCLFRLYATRFSSKWKRHSCKV